MTDETPWKKQRPPKMDGRFKICCSLFGRKKIGDVYGMSIGAFFVDVEKKPRNHGV